MPLTRFPRYSLAEVTELSLDPNWADSDPDSNFALILDLNRDQDHSTLRALAPWLRQQSVPIIGFGEHAPDELQDSFDLIICDEAELHEITEKVSRNPKASAITVQVLRASMRLSSPQALSVESMGYATLQAGEEYSHWLKHRPQVPTRKGMDVPVLMSREGACVSISLNSPQNNNALSVAMRDALSESFKTVAMDSSIHSVMVTGAGANFCAGGDLSEFKKVEDVSTAHQIRMLRMPARYMIGSEHKYTFRLHGACIGAGIELASFAKHVTARADAYFRLPEVSMGLLPGAGGCVSIPRRIGRRQAARIIISGQDISADEALSIGLIDGIDG